MESKRSHETDPCGLSSTDATLSISISPEISGNSPEKVLPPSDPCPSCSGVRLPNGFLEHAPGCSVSLQNLKNFQIKMAAAQIKSGKQLRNIIKDASPRLRRQVFDLIVPHITYFKPPSYERLMGGPRGRN